MRFVDEVEIVVQSGRGGRGSSSFRHEKYVPEGGPDGGDGGRGGHVILRATPGLTTLLDLRARSIWKGEDGAHGGKRRQTGAQGEDMVIPVPPGTIVADAETGTVLFELLHEGEERIAVPGGKGGLGHIHFKTATNRAPRETTPGDRGRLLRLHLELRLIADVGLLGYPNAGKSTLISVISAARPKVADYPFTTLVPNLGVVAMGTDGAFVVADIPGLIAGAAEGRGLGHQFLRHVERTRLLLHLVSLDPTDVLEDEEALDVVERAVHRWRVLRDELRRYDTDLPLRPEIVVLTKIDTADEALRGQAEGALRAAGAAVVLSISAVTGEGVRGLLTTVWARLQESPGVADAAPGV